MSIEPFDVEACRQQFPALTREVFDRPAIFFDGPAGSQTPQRVIDAVAYYLAHTNANHGGAFVTSRDSDRLLEEAHRAVADLLGTDEPEQVIFGANMTTLTLHLSRSLASTWNAGDEVLVTSSDHDANITPWVLAARDAGAVVKHVRIHPEDCTLDLEDLREKLSSRTRLLALGCVSNSSGTIHPVAEITRWVHEAGGEVFLDAVHQAPHLAMDVRRWNCDYIACSAYKFFGPHVGMLWGRKERLQQLPAYKLRPVPETLPDRWMTGTQNHEGIAGTLAAIEYLADLGRSMANDAADRRTALLAAYRAIARYEQQLAVRMLEGLNSLDSIRIWGIRETERIDQRVSTFSFTHDRLSPQQLAERLAQRGIFVWHGNYYALALSEALGLEPAGAVRAGLLHYNTAGEVDRFIEVLGEIAG